MTKKASIAIFLLVLLGIAAVLFVFGTQQLYPEEIEYNGQTLTWSKIPFADYYEIYIDDNEPIVQTAAAYTFPNGGSFRVRIVVHKKFGSLFSPCEATQSFTFLPKVTDLSYQDGVLSWKAIPDATSYEVKATTASGTSVFHPAENRLPYTEAGTVSFEVIARGAQEGADYSYWSNKYEITILNTPQALTYDAAAGRLDWATVNGAQAYRVQIDGQAPVTVTEPTYPFDADGASFSVSVQAVGNADTRIFDSQYSTARNYTYLPGVDADSICFADGVLTWDAVTGADDYLVTVNGQTLTVRGNQYEGLAPTAQHQISILPVCPINAYSYPSAAVASYLAQPTVTVAQTANGVRFTWDAIDGADRYVGVLSKNGTILNSDIALTDCHYDNPLVSDGSYTFTVRAISDLSTCYDSAAAAPCAVVRMAPCAGSSISEDRTTLLFEPIAGARTYFLSISNGVTCENWAHTSLPLSSYTAAGTYTVKIYAESYVHEDGTLYIGSQTAHDATFTKLAAPQSLIANKAGDLVTLQWTAVSGAGSYLLQVERTDEHFDTVTISLDRTRNSISWSELLTKLKNANRNWTHGVFSVKVCAVGQGEYLSSSFVGDVTLHAFAAPSNLRADGSVLCWNAAGASGYTYRVSLGNGTHTVLTTDPFLDLSALDGYSIPTGASVLVSVTTVNGPTTVPNATTVCSSVELWSNTVQALKAPTNVTLQNGTLTWNAVPHAKSYTLLVQYRDGASLVTAHTVSELTACSVSLSDFEAYLTQGKANVLTVLAKGEHAEAGVYYLSGAGTSTDDLTVLATPTLTYDSATNTLHWEQADGSYKVVISDEQGELSSFRSSVTSMNLSDLGNGSHTIYVQFVANASNTVSSTVAQITVTVS